MDNTIIFCNNALNFSLKQNVNNINDLLYNIQNLKQLQFNIDKIQELKDETQMIHNMASLSYFRKYILNVSVVGPMLFKSLIRKFYPLNDEQIYKYEVFQPKYYQITNLNVLRRKGYNFNLRDRYYSVDPNPGYSNTLSKELVCEISRDDMIHKLNTNSDVYQYNYKIDFHGDEKLGYPPSSGCSYRNSLMRNEFTKWDWDLVKQIAKRAYENLRYDNGLRLLMLNRGFIAQMGINNIEDTILKLQEISNNRIYIGEDTIAEYNTMNKIVLYSYLPIDEEFIKTHSDNLDWTVLIRNPHIEWNFELINMLLKRIQSNISETDWYNYLYNPSYAIYQAIEPYLNDELINDIEKLYDL